MRVWVCDGARQRGEGEAPSKARGEPSGRPLGGEANNTGPSGCKSSKLTYVNRACRLEYLPYA